MAQVEEYVPSSRKRGGPSPRDLLPYAALSVAIHITLIALLMTIKMGVPQVERVAFVDLVDVPRALSLSRAKPGALPQVKPTLPQKRKKIAKPAPLPQKPKGEILRGKVPDLPVNPDLPPEKAFPAVPPLPKESEKAGPEVKEKSEGTKGKTAESSPPSGGSEEPSGGGEESAGGEEKIPDIKKITPTLGKMVIAASRRKAKGKGQGTGQNLGSQNEAKKKGGFSEVAQGGTVLTPLNSPSIQYISYFASIKRKIELVWQYPFDAIQRGLQGETVVDFSIGKDGKLRKVELVESSGFSLLDDEAVEAIKKAAPFGPIPKQYKIDALNIRAHFIYELHFLNVR
ncbi:MAG: energy transducer TonB [Deltaproteobacteria bacterium]|nr:MAG: energy transducer TonB [Deltaproteobacteria bacterium]